MKIVVIEDQAPVASMLVDSLTEHGHAASSAGTASEGLRLVREVNPDAVFLDLVLPGANGVEVLRHIRQHWPALPVIVITGFAESEAAEECRRLGALEVVQKPTILANLMGALQKVRPPSP